MAEGTSALVTPQNWWFLSSYKGFRVALLSNTTFRCLVTLGEEAWQSFGDRGPTASMIIFSNELPAESDRLFAIDALPLKTIDTKIKELMAADPIDLTHAEFKKNPDARLALQSVGSQNLLDLTCDSWQGLVTSDNPRFMFLFWEVWGEG